LIGSPCPPLARDGQQGWCPRRLNNQPQCAVPRSYAAQLRRHEAECQRLRAVIEARRAMGAAPPRELGRRPRCPQLRLVSLFGQECVAIIKEGARRRHKIDYRRRRRRVP
jgi:hypothetical protein